MKHVRALTVRRAVKASALDDFLNAVWQAWLDYIFSKKNQQL